MWWLDWEVRALRIIPALQGVRLRGSGGLAELANEDEITSVHHELAIAETDQCTVVHFAKDFDCQSEILSHYLVCIRVHSPPSLVEI